MYSFRAGYTWQIAVKSPTTITKLVHAHFTYWLGVTLGEGPALNYSSVHGHEVSDCQTKPQQIARKCRICLALRLCWDLLTLRL